ncbi:TPA: hypothetical protein EYN98_22620 [Candidatus Poribacteria bacterium]|jgi:hypothetical protein|nr:hypothetical protein [Candidatus Poribacteria bacterium]HIA68781.1 hypothetical protein [Candidatus Poribacteria bacterium]HIB87090.1 hypothetical protein [Candidatus Poribacteria bacterium]HIC02843.1 hypothetical protein [Candidatus Poribacteria bacterium]HIC18990.1 hypothetical protein [Candidatus Poribacteria bacterium]
MGFQEIITLMIVAGSAFFLGNRWFGKSTTNCGCSGCDNQLPKVAPTSQKLLTLKTPPSNDL